MDINKYEAILTDIAIENLEENLYMYETFKIKNNNDVYRKLVVDKVYCFI